MTVGSLVSHHPDRANVGEDGEGLPNLAFETCATHLLAHDGVGILQERDPFGRHLADDAHA